MTSTIIPIQRTTTLLWSAPLSGKKNQRKNPLKNRGGQRQSMRTTRPEGGTVRPRSMEARHLLAGDEDVAPPLLCSHTRRCRSDSSPAIASEGGVCRRRALPPGRQASPLDFMNWSCAPGDPPARARFVRAIFPWSPAVGTKAPRTPWRRSPRRSRTCRTRPAGS